MRPTTARFTGSNSAPTSIIPNRWIRNKSVTIVITLFCAVQRLSWWVLRAFNVPLAGALRHSGCLLVGCTKQTLSGSRQEITATVTLGTIRKIFLRIECKMLAMPGVAVLECHPYRQIPIVIHVICQRHHPSFSTLTVRSSLRILALARVVMSLCKRTTQSS